MGKHLKLFIGDKI